MATQAERSEATTKQLVGVARDLFAERGFAGTSIEDIVQAAGVTRGALYHHFDSKTDVFRAVFEDAQRDIARMTVEAARMKRGAWRQIEAGATATLDAFLDPGLQQIVLLDAAAVLGWEGRREIQSRHCIVLWVRGLENAIAEGTLRKRPVEPLAHILFGAVCEAAMTVARADDQQRAMHDVRREVRELLAALAAHQ